MSTSQEERLLTVAELTAKARAGDMNLRGYWGVALYHPRKITNWGTVVRTAYNFGADILWTIGTKMPSQASNTGKAERHIPMCYSKTMDEFLSASPSEATIILLEVDGTILLENLIHPERVLYVFGGENISLPHVDQGKRTMRVKIETNKCLNVAMAAGIVMYDRHIKRRTASSYQNSKDA